MRPPKRNQKPKVLEITDLPDSVNWVTKGDVPPVHDQGQCGSSSIFSIVDSLTSALAI